jgi:hypothetical protein
MKRLEDMTTSDLLSIKDQDFNALVDLECAWRSIPLLPPNPGVAPTPPDLKKLTDDDYYRPKIETIKIATAESYKTREHEIASYVVLKKKYENMKNAYDGIYKQRKEVMKEITNAVEGAIDAHNRIVNLQQVMAKYREMADNNEDVAIRFLESAYNLSDEDRAMLGIAPVIAPSFD